MYILRPTTEAKGQLWSGKEPLELFQREAVREVTPTTWH